MPWTCRTGFHLVGKVPGDAGYATNPAPTLAQLNNNTITPQLGTMRKRMLFSDAPFIDQASYMADVVAAGFFPIVYLDGGAWNQSDATFDQAIDDWVSNMMAVGVSTFEVGNEIPYAYASAYWAKLKRASPIIRAKGGTVLMSSAGSKWPPNTTPGENGWRMLQAADAQSIWGYLDGVASHIYAGPGARTTSPDGPILADGSLTKLQKIRSTLDGFAAYLELWITEFGWATGPTPITSSSDPLVGTEAQQAARLTSVFGDLIPAAQANKVRALCWFATRDYSSATLDWPNFCGVMHEDLTHKPSYGAIQTVGPGTVDTNMPTVTTGAADNQTASGITVHATVNPHGLSTSHFFQYGVDLGYGQKTSTVTGATGSADIAISRAITTLAPDTYHYRIVAFNNAGMVVGDDQTFSIAGGGAGDKPVSIQELVNGLTPDAQFYCRLVGTNSEGTVNGDILGPFGAVAVSAEENLTHISALRAILAVEVSTPDGRTYRFDADAQNASDKPTALSFSTSQGNGFAEGSYSLGRRIDIDYPDLNLLDTHRFLGADGEIVYEGRVASLARNVNQDGEAINVQLEGLMTSATDRQFMEVFVDRVGDRWAEPTLALRKALLVGDTVVGADYQVTVDAGSIHFKGPNNNPGGNSVTIPSNSQTIIEYIAPTGVKLAQIQYSGTERNTSNGTNSVDVAKLLATDDGTVTFGSWDETGITLGALDGTLRSSSSALPRSIYALRMRSSDDQAPTKPVNRTFDQIAVYADHGVPLRNNGNQPDGVFASDVIIDLIERFCPQLDPRNVERTSTVIPHLVFDTPTTPFDAFTLLNGYEGIWNLGCWEDGRVTFAPADLTNADWQIRRDDWGVDFALQGDESTDLANGCVVAYTDVDQRQQVLWPYQHREELSDESPNNPCNKQGVDKWLLLSLSTPSTLDAALTLGRAALLENNRPKAPGTISIPLGYIEDTAGNLTPGSKVRAGDAVITTDLPNDTPRLIIATSWSEDGALTLTLEQPGKEVDSALARLELLQSTAGL